MTNHQSKGNATYQQVIVLVVLLVLASSLDSPLLAGSKQVEATDACPRPVLFQSWMIVQIVRLTVCWSISCWVAVRAHRRGRGQSSVHEEGQIQMYVRSPSNIHQLMTRNNPTSPAGSIPLLTHSSSSSSDTTLADHSEYPRDIRTTPGQTYARNMHSSSSSDASIDMLSMMKGTKQEGGMVVSAPSTPGYARSTASREARNSTLDLARASHLAQCPPTASAGPRPGLATRFEMIAPK